MLVHNQLYPNLGNTNKLAFLACSLVRLLLLPSLLIDVVRGALLADLVTNELQRGQVEAHLVLLAGEDPAQR